MIEYIQNINDKLGNMDLAIEDSLENANPQTIPTGAMQNPEMRRCAGYAAR